jgi:hypothetical protein
VTVAAFPEHEFDKRDEHVAQLYHRAVNCTPPCQTIMTALECTTADCLCSMFQTINSTSLSDCVNCLEPVRPTLAGNITLFANVCSKCQSICSGSLSAYLQTNACNSSAIDSPCVCSLFDPVGATAITACASCIQPFDQFDSMRLLVSAQQCGIISGGNPSASASVSASAPASTTISATASAQSSAASSAPAASKSDATRLSVHVFGSLVWVALILKTVFIAFL